MRKKYAAFAFSSLYSIRFASKVARKKNGWRGEKVVEKKWNSSASGERVIGELGGTGSCYTVKRGMEKEIDSIRWRKDLPKPPHLCPPSFLYPSSFRWREISNVSGCRRRVSRDSAKLTHRMFVKRCPDAKREETRWKRTPCKRRHAEFAG